MFSNFVLSSGCNRVLYKSNLKQTHCNDCNVSCGVPKEYFEILGNTAIYIIAQQRGSCASSQLANAVQRLIGHVTDGLLSRDTIVFFASVYLEVIKWE